MDSVLKFLIKLQADRGNVMTVARQVNSELGRIERAASRAGRMIRNAFSFSSFRTSLMSLPGMSFFTNPYTVIAAGVGALARVGAQAESTSVAFNVLVGSEQKAARLLQNINDFAAATPFDNLQLTKNAQQMLAFGVETDKVMTYLKQLGDISKGDANTLNALSLVFGQVSAAGKLSGQDLLQFINAGFNPLKELEAMTGKSYKDLQDIMSKGGISVKHVAAAIEHATSAGGRFYGMMDKQSQTLSGKFSTLVGNIQQSIVILFAKIKPGLMALVEGVNHIIPPVMHVISMLFDIIGGAVGWVVKYRTEIAHIAAVVAVATLAINAHRIALLTLFGVQKMITIVTKSWIAAQWLLNAAMSANPIGIVITAIAALVSAVVYCYNKFAGFRAFLLTMWDVVKGFGSILKEYIIDRIKSMLSGLGMLGDALRKLFAGDFRGSWQTALEGVKELSGYNTIAGTVQKVKTIYDAHYVKEKRADDAKTNKITTPGLVGSKEKAAGVVTPGLTSSSKNTVNDIMTGGTRNTSITMNVGKFFDNINVYMNDKTDTSELERVILESINRSLAIATSTDR